MFSLEQKKEFVLSAKFRAQFEKVREEAIRKEIQENKDNYSSMELEVLNKLLEESIETYNKENETYIKGSVLVGAEELKESSQRHRDLLNKFLNSK